jgi:hypothetical protein
MTAKRLPVVAVEHVVGKPVAALRRQARELHLLLDLLGVLAVEAHVPTRREQGLVDEAATGGGLVEREGRSDLLTLLAELVQLAGVLLRVARGLCCGALRLEPPSGLFVELLEHCLVLRLGEPQLLESVLRLRAAVRHGGRRHKFRGRFEFAAIDLDEEPARDVEELRQALERELAGDGAPWVRGVVAGLAHGVELVLHDLGHRLPEGGLVHQVVQVVRVRRAQPIARVDGRDCVLHEAALLDEGARGVFVGVAFGEASELG